MRGVPKWFNTVADVENSLAVDKEATQAKLAELLKGRFAWFQAAKLENGAAGVEDSTHKVVRMREGMDGPEERWQYELREDENALMFRIGLTVDRINEMLRA